MARLLSYGPTGDADNDNRYSAGESNTGLPEDYSLHYRRMGNNQKEFFYDVSSVGAAATPSFTDTFRRTYIRVWRFPSVQTAIWFDRSNLHAGSAGLLTISPTGVLVLNYQGLAAFPGTALVTATSPLILGQWHEIKIEAAFTSVETGDPTLFNLTFTGTLLVDGVGGSGSAIDSLSPFSALWTSSSEVLGRSESNAPLLDIDYSNHVVDSAGFPSTSRVTAVRCAANGTYQQWSNGGVADWRARNTWPGAAATSVVSTTGIQSNTAGQKQTYLMEALSVPGITGTILGAHIHIFFLTASASAPNLLVIRNGVEVSTGLWVQTNGQYLRYRLDTTGWAVGDTLEFGVQNVGGTTCIGSVVLHVEHDTAVPPITLGDISTDTASWTGNDTAQTSLLPLDGPQFIFWWPRTAAVPGGFWFAESNTAHQFNVPGASRPNLIVRGTSLQLVGSEGGGPNSSGVVYDALVILDPKMRSIAGGAYAQTTNVGDDAYAVAVLDPAGDPFTPETLWATQETINTTTFTRYYGVGMAGDLSSNLAAANAPAADFIEALTPLGFTAGTSLNNDVQQVGYGAFRTGDFNTSILMALFTYTGNGAVGNRTVPVSLGGLAVKWAVVVPQSSANRAMRNHLQSSGKFLNSSGGVYASSIEGLGVDSIDVGTALNQVDVVYSGMVWGYGTDPEPPPPPTPGEGCSPTLAAGTDSGGGVGCNSPLAAGTDSGGGSGCGVSF